jgi:superfamily I DNA and RNA helicase
LFPRIDVKPMMTTALDDAELKRIELSREQSAVLDILSRRNRALITGGAGTGKTLIAVEKVRRLAVDGAKTLLVCFNEALAQSLARALANLPNASAHTFHSLCGHILATVRRECGRDLLAEVQAEHSDWELYNQAIPEAASRASDLTELQFDAIVVDEAQDFRDTYWLPLELLLRGGSQGTLYIFFDSNQQIYGESLLHLPITEQPYLLSRNCRNAKPIHEVAYEYYSGDPTTASNIPGRVEVIAAATLQHGAKAITNTISELLLSEQVNSERIVVLIAGVPKLDYIEALEKCKLPGGYSWRFADAETEDKSRFIAVDTVQHFKGLESDVAFVWGVESAAGCDRPELLYIGFSRAKTMLFVVGSLPKH